MLSIGTHIHYHLITQWLHSHPEWGWLIAFLISFSESVAIIGSIVPGSVTMTAIGILIGSGVLPLWNTLIFAILGAILGDGLSFFIGYFFKNNIKRMWPFTHYPALLEKGQAFVKSHGGKSIFIGRFVGPVRAMVPLITGMLNMRPLHYLFASIPAAFLWALIYLFPGFLVGAIALEMPTDVATMLIVYVLGFLIATWAISKIVTYLYKKTHAYFAQLLNKKWLEWTMDPSKKWFCRLLRHASRPERGQILLAANALLAILFFFIIFINVIFHGPLTAWNEPVYHLFRGLRTTTLDPIMITITTFGTPVVYIPVLIILPTLLWLFKRRKIALHFFAGGFLAFASAEFFKHIFYSARPIVLTEKLSSSFPSGHTTLSITFLSLIAFFAGQNLSRTPRKILYWITAILCIAIAISRLYLSAHWLTDVLAATCLGLFCVAVTIISYHRQTSEKLNPIFWLLAAILTWGISGTVYLYNHYTEDTLSYQRQWQIHFVPHKTWWQKPGTVAPLYRANLVGSPTEILNIEWAGSLRTIQLSLKKQGWKSIHTRDYMTTLKKLAVATKNQIPHQSILPKVYDDQAPVLELIKFTKADQPPLILRLWNANVRLMPQDVPLFVGSIGYDEIQKKRFLFFHRKKAITPTLPSVFEQWSPDQTRFHYRIDRSIPITQLPKKLVKPTTVMRVILIQNKPDTPSE